MWWGTFADAIRVVSAICLKLNRVYPAPAVRGSGKLGAISLVFVDGDVTATPMWLQHVTEPLRNGRYADAGGRILPDWSAPRPRWFPVKARYALAPFAVFDLGSEAGQLSEPPLGTNMAFRKETFTRYGYAHTLDPCRRFQNKLNVWTTFGAMLECYQSQADPTPGSYTGVPTHVRAAAFYLLKATRSANALAEGMQFAQGDCVKFLC